MELLKEDLQRRFSADYKIWIFSDASSRARAESLFAEDSSIVICDTGRSVLDYAAKIKACDFIISTDSLGLHLAISQAVPNISFYAPTSAAEIDTFGTGTKLTSSTDDYCSYSVNADNSSITANKIFGMFVNTLL